MMNEKMYKDRVSKNIPVMETTIEGAQKRIAAVIDWYYNTGRKCANAPKLDYIAIFLDSVGDEMAAMTSAYNSLHERYVQALSENEQLKAQAKIDKATINAAMSSIHAANDNR